MALADRAFDGDDADVRFEASLVKAEALYRLDRQDAALETLISAARPDSAPESRFGAAGQVLSQCLVATVRLRRREPDDAILFGATLAEWLEEQPAVWCEGWLLKRASALCWYLGTWNHYPEALRLGRAIVARFAATDHKSMRLDLVETRLMVVVALRNNVPFGSDEEQLIADAIDDLISEGPSAIEVLDGWEETLSRMTGPMASPQIVMAETLKAMALARMGDAGQAVATLDAVIDRYDGDPSERMQRALDGAREVRGHEI